MKRLPLLVVVPGFFTLAGCEFHVGTKRQPQSPAQAAPAAPPPAAPAPPPPAATKPPVSFGRARIVLDHPPAIPKPPAPPPVTTPAATGLSAPTIFGVGQASADAWKGSLFFLPENTTQLPDLSKATSVGQVHATSLNITSRKFEGGFPGIANRTEWFAIRYEGPLEVTDEADYTLRLASDDGAVLVIDDMVIINLDGVHPSKDASQAVHFVKGTHSVRLDYFQAQADVALQLLVTPPNEAERPLTTKLSRAK